MVKGCGTYEKVDVRSLDSLCPADVVESSCFLVVLCVDREIVEGRQMAADLFELAPVWNP